MPTAENPLLSRLAIVPRVIAITFALTGLAFSVTLLLGIIGMAGLGAVRGHLPDMRIAYRHFALPIAVTVGSCAFIAAWIMEIRHYQQRKLLAGAQQN